MARDKLKPPILLLVLSLYLMKPFTAAEDLNPSNIPTDCEIKEITGLQLDYSCIIPLESKNWY